MGFVTIFVVFIGEDWNNVMYKHYRGGGWIAMVFFPILFIALNLILLNLFLAILLKNFDEVVDNDKSGDHDADASALRRTERRLRKYLDRLRSIRSCFTPKGRIRE